MRVRRLPCLVLLAAMLGCGACIPKDKYDAVIKENESLRSEIAQLRQQLNEKPKHNYSLHNEGFRTFRFDSETGKSCILLATKYDWKNADVKAQSCACEDLLENDPSPSTMKMRFYCGF